jgi:hypothetical protein
MLNAKSKPTKMTIEREMLKVFFIEHQFIELTSFDQA